MTPAYYESVRGRIRRLEAAIVQIKSQQRHPERAVGALLTALQKELDALRASMPRYALEAIDRR